MSIRASAVVTGLNTGWPGGIGTAAGCELSAWRDRTEHAAHDASSCVKWPRWFPAASTCADRPKPRLSERGATAIQDWARTASKAASRHPRRRHGPLVRRTLWVGLSIRSNRIPAQVLRTSGRNAITPVATLWPTRTALPLRAAKSPQGGATTPRHAIFGSLR